jgi:hypothetical protein
VVQWSSFVWTVPENYEAHDRFPSSASSHYAVRFICLEVSHIMGLTINDELPVVSAVESSLNGAVFF